MQQLLLVDPECAARVQIGLTARYALALDVRATNDVQGAVGFGAREQAAALFRIALTRVLENLEQELARELRGLLVWIRDRGSALAPVLQRQIS
jgi:hypothetical protein